MKPSPFFFGRIEKGRLILNNEPLVKDWLRGQPDNKVKVQIRPTFKLRSTGQPDELGNQNGYYWAVVVEILHAEMGLTRMDCHEVLKAKFNPKGVTYRTAGGPVQATYGATTTRMSTKRFMEYCEDIRNWAADPTDGLDVYIPAPNETPEGEAASKK